MMGTSYAGIICYMRSWDEEGDMLVTMVMCRVFGLNA